MYPIIDLHCDLLSYLINSYDRTPYDLHNIGASIPYLKKGNVSMQIMAIFSKTCPGSTSFAWEQVDMYEKLITQKDILAFDFQGGALTILDKERIPPHMYHAIENASGMWEEEEELACGFTRMERYMSRLGKPFYISLTHNTENRFGGGNYSANVGLKPDGKALLAWMDEKGLAVDLSHTSDALAVDILTFIEKQNLKIPVLASHSNAREVYSHLRNLPTEVIQEIILRDGLIGINFFKPFVHDSSREGLFDHIDFYLAHEGEHVIAFGADFFDVTALSVPQEGPLFFSNYHNAAFYPLFLAELEKREFNPTQISKLAWKNVIRFVKQHLVQND